MPAKTKSKLLNQKETTKIYEPNEIVLFRSESNTDVKWRKAKILNRLSKCRYNIEIVGLKKRKEGVHGDQLRPFNEENTVIIPPIIKEAENQTEEEEENTSFDSDPPSLNTSTTSESSDTSISARELRNKPRLNYHEPTLRRKPSKRKKRPNTTQMLEVTLQSGHTKQLINFWVLSIFFSLFHTG